MDLTPGGAEDGATPDEDAASDRAETVLGERYVLREELGTGGNATVHAADDRRLGRRVAVKTLHPDLVEDTDVVAAFVREAWLAAALNHPNVVAVHDVGEDTLDDQQVPWMALEYVDGTTLREPLAQNGPMHPGRALSVLADVLLGLQHSHERGVIHRDVSPGNVMVTEAGQVKVTDFGIAAAVGTFVGKRPEGSDDEKQPARGTPAYVSPEQARGEEVDARSDIYSAGCLLFALLTGEPPFTTESVPALVYSHAHDTPPAPSTVNPDLPAFLDPIVLRALAKRPADRYADATAMRSAVLGASERLRRIDEILGTVAPPPTSALGDAGAEAPQDESLEAGGVAPAEDDAPTVAGLVPPVDEFAAPVDDYVGAVDEFAALADDYIRPIDEFPPPVDDFPFEESERPGATAPAGGPAFPSAVAGPAFDPFDEVVPGGPGTYAAWRSEPPGPVPGFPDGYAEDVDDDTATTSDRQRRLVMALALAGVFVLVSGVIWGVAALGPEETERAAVDEVVVPSLAGLSVDEARNRLRSVGLRAGRERFEASRTVPARQVTRTDPAAGARVAEDHAVTLMVSAGANQSEVPDLVGRTLARARSALADVDLRLGTVDVRDSPQPKGTVLQSTPEQGTPAPPGSDVDVVVASGWSVVPDVRQLGVDEARSLVEEAGFVMANAGVAPRSAASAAAPGTVARTLPAAGKRAKIGSRVRILLAPPDPAPSPGPSRTRTSPTPTPTRTPKPDPTTTSPAPTPSPTTTSPQPTPTPTPTTTEPTPTPTTPPEG